MRVLFVTQFAMHFHYLKSIMRSLCERGHAVKFLLIQHGKYNKESHLAAIEAFAREFPSFEYDWAKTRKGGLRTKLLFFCRDIANYRRYLAVGAESPHYRARTISHFPLWLQKFLKFQLVRVLLKTNGLGRMLNFVENVSPPDSLILREISEFKPDAIMCSPVNMRRSFFAADLEYLKAAKYLGIPTFVPIVSWDNLTTKGNFHVMPDLFFMWNGQHVREGKSHHQIPEEKMRVIGAPLFDGWFENLRLTRSREEFCREFGLRPEDPFVLYLGSSKNIAKDETWLLEKLRSALDASPDEKVRRVQIAVRPHPSNFENYKKITRPGVVIVPKEGTLPDRPEDLFLFYDSVYHSLAAVDGVNTSGIIDAMIVGKSAVAILTKEYHETQTDTYYFRELLDRDIVHTVSPEKFPEAVKEILEGRDVRKSKREEFIKTFIRPRGFEHSAGEMAVREIEEFLKKTKHAGKTSRF